MKINLLPKKRREFIKTLSFGIPGISIHSTLKNNYYADREINKNIELLALEDQQFNMSGYSAPKLEIVRVGIIGLGNRGPAHMMYLQQVEGVKIIALCDLLTERAASAQKRLAGTVHNPVIYSGSEDEWKKLCERDDIDLIVITTPWYMHAEMAVYAMQQDKHVITEVPAAGTIDECWKLVRTSEKMKKHCMMLSNSNYMEFQLLTLNMAEKGFFGDVVHADCAYNTSKMKNNFSKTMYWDMWWLKQYASRKGNIYPTHGLGPVCMIMDINRGDRLDFLVSVESNDFMMKSKAKELSVNDDFFKYFSEKNYRGNMNTTTIRTKKGKTIMLQHDATSPSPHSMIHGIYGTKGAALMDPQPPRLSSGNHEWVSQSEFNILKEKYIPFIIKKMGELTKKSGHGGSDQMMIWQIIDCLRNGLPLPMDVYDAASWSAIVPLSEKSVNNRSLTMDIPDFTSGKWESNTHKIDINLKFGSNTRLI